MKLFVATSSIFASAKPYKPGLITMAREYGHTVVFADEATDAADPAAAIAETLEDCRFAFFDLTGFDPDVLMAYGVARQSDAACFALIDTEEHRKLANKRDNARLASRVAIDKEFHEASDFQRKIHAILDSKIGAEAMIDMRLVQKIKDQIKAKGPIYMRQIAGEIGRSMQEVQPIVWELVRQGDVKKTGENRWSRYEPK